MALLGLLGTTSGFSQKRDTITINASRVNTAPLKPGVNRYLVYFKNGRDSSRIGYQIWTRTINFLNYRGRDAVSIRQEWEDNTSVTHRVYSVNDRKTFAPLFHDTWWKRSGSGQFDFISRTARFRDTILSSSDTVPAKKKMFEAFSQALDQYVLNWHLDLEVFSTLPYREHVSFRINFYDPGFGAPAGQVYSVTGSGFLTGYNDQKIDCWLLTHNSASGKETFWISKKTREVLKLEQEFNGRFRYKVKLGFSS